MISITVPLVPPSPNVLRRQFRNPHEYKRLREVWEHSLAYAVGSATLKRELQEQAMTRRVRVRITIHHSRRYDEDNIYGSIKPVLDALRNVGYIHDDNRKWIDLELRQEDGRNTMERKTVVELEGL
jgi:Holliday junction resolvase RusA-like endonuclease